MTALHNHPNFWLEANAAAAFDRAEADHGILKVNSAGRTEAEQQALINRWNKGGAANRPPYLYKPAMPASSSNHVSGGGKAIDIADYKKFAAYSAAYGFIQSFPGSDPVHFDYHGTTSSGSPGANQVTRDRQNWILIHPGISVGPTGADGIEGPSTRAAYKKYQEFLRDNGFGYDGKIDGIWGSGTQLAHSRYYSQINTPPIVPPVVGAPGHVGGVIDLGKLSDVRGLQKIAKLNGGKTLIDNKWGAESQRGMQNFLNANYGGSLAKWLRTKWGYSDKDDLWGPNMRAASVRANAANFKALP